MGDPNRDFMCLTRETLLPIEKGHRTMQTVALLLEDPRPNGRPYLPLHAEGNSVDLLL